MASLIKNQILKHLSKFTKNLSPDKIHLSTLRGEGEMSNLELDENVLMELLELPTWLRLTSATCNKVAIKIQWTKLKAQPICLYLDEIVVEMETCSKPREPSVSSNLSSYSTGGKYGFAERIIDGMFVSINSVVVNFKAPTFHSSIQISRIIVSSKTPLWQTGDLRLTRVKDEMRGEILIFKEAEWQTLRMEANALDGSDPSIATTPLRLIANQSKTRITIKKRLNDCGIVNSRVQLNLDDLLWVLTDSQLKAAILFVNSLKEVIQRSAHQSKMRATDKLKAQGVLTSQPKQPQSQAPRTGSKSQVAMGKLFDKYNVAETSYHLHTGRIDLHLCDDMAPALEATNTMEEEKDSQRRKVEGGAMQITLHKLALDHYPFHPAGTDRHHWVKHDENMMARNAWAQDLLNVFREEVCLVRESMTTPPPSPGGRHHQNPPNRTQGQAPRGQGQGSKTVKAAPAPRVSTKLMESCLVLRVEDFTLYRVSTAHDNKRNSPRKFICSDKKQLLLPQDMSSIHVEYTDYYFPEGVHFPVPHPNLFIVVNPLRLTLDWISLLWLNAFCLNLLQSLELPVTDTPRIHTDIKLDALMPRVLMPAETAVKGQSDRPDSLQIQASRLTLTNCHIEAKASLPELAGILQKYENSHFFSETKRDFPNEHLQLVSLPEIFRQHADKDDDVFLDKTIGDVVLGRRTSVSNIRDIPTESQGGGATYYSMSTDSLKLNANKDMWCLAVDQFWMDFVGVPSAHNRPVPFAESFPLTVWIANPLLNTVPNRPSIHDRRYRDKRSSLEKHMNGDVDVKPATETATDAVPFQKQSLKKAVPQKRLADTHILVKIGTKISLQLNHCQYVFLLRLIESVTKFTRELQEDTGYILGDVPVQKSMVIAIKLREAELALICPPIPEMPGAIASGSREDSDDLKMLDDLPEDASRLLPPAGDMGDDSALGGSIHSEDRSNSLQAPIPLLKSHSDTELTIQEPIFAPMSPAHMGGTPPHPHSASPRERHMSGESMPRIQISDGSSISVGSQQDLSVSYSHERGRALSIESMPTDLSDRDLRKGGEIRKSFNAAFSGLTKLTEKVKQNVKALDVSDDADDWDALSNKSGASSDDEEFVFLKLQNASEVPAFEQRHSSLETVSVAGSDGRDGDSGSMTTMSSAAEKARGVVSVVSFKLLNAETVIQMMGEDLTVSAQVYHIMPQEYGNINLDKFHQKFTTPGGKQPEEKLPTCGDPPLKLRFQSGPAAEHLMPSASELGFLHTRINGFHTKLNMSSVMNLVDLIEDEIIPPPMPLMVEASDVTITLQNDMPPTHVTSPEPVPLDFHVAQVTLNRANDGIFRITAGTIDHGRPERMHSRSKMRDSSASPDLHDQRPLQEALAKIQSQFVQLERVKRENSALRDRIVQVEEELDTRLADDAKNAKVEALETENEMLRHQLEKIASMDGGFYQQEKMQREMERWKVQAHDAETAQRENAQLIQQLTQQQDEIHILKQERDSLLATLQLLQEELNVSESMRARNTPPKS